MRRMVLTALLLAAWTGTAGADQGDKTEIESVIQGQVSAFLAGDTEKAFSYASPLIRSIFGTPESFGQMVQSGYPIIWNPSEVRYLGLRTERGTHVQRVLFRDSTGRIGLFDYEMTKGADGWQINGVYPVEGPATGA